MEFFPKVSILIPTYNYAHYLDESIQSALGQTYTDFELIIVDDQSKDNTDEVVQKYLGDKRVSYYKNPVNLGLVGNFNKCLGYAKGKYIKYLLADDKFHPQLLEKFVPIMEQYPNVSLTTSNSEMFGLRCKKRQQPFQYLQEGRKVIYESLKEGSGNWIGEPTTVMFRKSDLIIGSFNSKFTCLVDWEMWLRLLSVGDCYIIPETLSYFRTHASQASKVVLENSKYTFEDYYFYKDIKMHNNCKVDFSQLDIDKTIKKKAAYCAKAMYRVIPRLYKKENQAIFKKGLRIAFSENVLFSPFKIYLRNLKERY